jgi:magnesium transporter
MKIIAFEGRTFHEAALSELPALLSAETGMVWVDLTRPSEEELGILRDVFHFHSLAIEDTRNHKQRPKLEVYADYLFIILNSVTQNGDSLTFWEIDIFVGSNYVVTVHQQQEAVVNEVSLRLDRLGAAATMFPGFLLYMLMDAVVDNYFPVLDMVEEEIEHLGDVVLANPRPESLGRLFELKGLLIDMWRVIWPQRDILNNITHHPMAFVNEELLQPYLRDVNDHLMWIADMVSTFRDTLTSVIDLYMSAVSNRLSIVVNRLTVFTVMIGLMGAVAGFYGMNFQQTWPPFESGWGVPFVLLLMSAVAGTLLYVLKRLKWY